MKLKDIQDDGLFTWWTIVNKNGKVIAQYCNKECIYKHCVGSEETCVEKYNKYKECKVISIYDIDIDMNWENNYITVKLNID